MNRHGARSGAEGPRVAVVRHDRFPGEPHLRRSVHALRDAGFVVDVICDHEPGKPRRENLEGVMVFRWLFQHKRHGLLRYAFEYASIPFLASLIVAARSLRKPYRYVEIDNPPDWLVLAGVIPRLQGAKVVLYMFENMPELLAADRGTAMTHPAMRALVLVQRACARLANCLIAPHEMARRILIEQGVPAGKIAAVVPNGPDPRVFLARVSREPDSYEVDEQHRTRLAIAGGDCNSPESGFRLVTHGTLLQRYGIETLIEAVALLRDQLPGLHLDVIGEGEYRPQLEALTSRLGVNDYISFIDRVPFDQLALYLLQADVGLVPVWAPFVPNKLMEYLMLGLPVITTDSAAVRHYFDDDAVCYVEAKNVHGLAEAILSLYRNPERRKKLAEVGHAVYRECYAWDRVKHQYIGVFDGTRENSGVSDAKMIEV